MHIANLQYHVLTLDAYTNCYTVITDVGYGVCNTIHIYFDMG